MSPRRSRRAGVRRGLYAVLAAPLLLARRAQVGGQAVIEGVMMRGVSNWSLAVRKPDETIALHHWPLVSWMQRHPILKLPVLRGVVALVESMVIGVRALALSAKSVGVGRLVRARRADRHSLAD